MQTNLHLEVLMYTYFVADFYKYIAIYDLVQNDMKLFINLFFFNYKINVVNSYTLS